MKTDAGTEFCGGGWSGCTESYTGGHVCARLPGHKPPHVCVQCGAKTASRAADPYSVPPKDNSTHE